MKRITEETERMPTGGRRMTDPGEGDEKDECEWPEHELHGVAQSLLHQA
jgi:hypothetical protein